MLHYLLLMRHGKHEASNEPNQPPGRKLSADGMKETKEVVETLARVLAELKGDENFSINLRIVWWAPTDEAAETTKVVCDALKIQPDNCLHKADLDPDVFKPHRNTDKHREVAVAATRELLRARDANEALMIIGHQPFLSWLAHEVTGEAIPLTHSEVACIAFENLSPGKKPRGYLRWVLTPSSRASTAELAELKAKIKSKMGIARTLGATITVVLGFLLGYMVDEAKVTPLTRYPFAVGALRLSTISFFIALALFLATIYAYDVLLMPARFWGEAPLTGKRPKWLVWRPPSSALWVLHQNMMRIWRYLFKGATWAVVAGLLLLAYAVFHPPDWILFVAITVIGLGAFWFWYRRFGPRLGSED